MASIVENQRVAFLARAQDDARQLARSLANLSDAQRAAILAIVAKRTCTPVDMAFWADHGDEQEIAYVVAGELRLDPDNQDTYLLGSGCLFTVTPAPGIETPHD